MIGDLKLIGAPCLCVLVISLMQSATNVKLGRKEERSLLYAFRLVLVKGLLTLLQNRSPHRRGRLLLRVQ